MRPRTSLFGILLSLLVLCTPAIRAQDGLPGALSRINDGVGVVSPFAQGVAIADFDNDQMPDGAVLLEAGQVNGQQAFRIELHLTAGRNATINFSTAETKLSIAALDVNRDGAPDIVVEKALTHERLQVYLNNGHGEFQKTSERFAAPDDSEPLWRAKINIEDLPVLFLPPTHGYEVAADRPSPFVPAPDAGDAVLRPETLLVRCGGRAPSATRAPPSFRCL
jgi:hypothetical protein